MGANKKTFPAFWPKKWRFPGFGDPIISAFLQFE